MPVSYWFGWTGGPGRAARRRRVRFAGQAQDGPNRRLRPAVVPAGINAAQQGQWREAEVFFSRACEMCPLDEQIRYHYAETLWQLGSLQPAVAHMEEAVRLSGGNAELVVRLGDMYLASGDLQRAALQAELAIQTNRQLASAWALRGDVLREMGHDEEALASYHRAMSYQSHYPRVQLATADIYGRQKRHARRWPRCGRWPMVTPAARRPNKSRAAGTGTEGTGPLRSGCRTPCLGREARSTEHGNPGAIGRDPMVGRRRRQRSPDPANGDRPVVAGTVAEPLTAQVDSLQRKLTGDMRL